MITCFIRYHIDPTKKLQFEQYRQRLSADPLGKDNYEYAQREKFLLREDRTFLKQIGGSSIVPGVFFVVNKSRRHS